MLSSKITVVDRAEGFGVKVECNPNTLTYFFHGHLDHATEFEDAVERIRTVLAQIRQIAEGSRGKNES
jgi:hypothetical protein